jgi:hypothetical protein
MLSPRAGGPSVGSPARQGGVFKGAPDTRSEGPALRLCRTFGAPYQCTLIPALRPGLLSVGPSGLIAKIRHRNCEQQH